MMTFSPSKAELDGNLNSNNPNAFAILGSTIYGFSGGAAIANGATGTLYYIKTDARASNGDTNDITIDGIWFETVVNIAAAIYFEEKGDIDAAQGYLRRMGMVFDLMRAM